MLSCTKRCIAQPRTSPKNLPVSLSWGLTTTYPWLSRTKQSNSSDEHVFVQGPSRHWLVIFCSNVTSAECLNWNPITAAGAFFPPSVWKTAWLAVTSVSFFSAASKGTEYTKLDGSMKWCSTARLYHSSSMARVLLFLKSCLGTMEMD